MTDYSLFSKFVSDPVDASVVDDGDGSCDDGDCEDDETEVLWDHEAAEEVVDVWNLEDDESGAGLEKGSIGTGWVTQRLTMVTRIMLDRNALLEVIDALYGGPAAKTK